MLRLAGLSVSGSGRHHGTISTRAHIGRHRKHKMLLREKDQMISINSYVDNFRGSFEDTIKEDSKKSTVTLYEYERIG